MCLDDLLLPLLLLILPAAATFFFFHLESSISRYCSCVQRPRCFNTRPTRLIDCDHELCTRGGVCMHVSARWLLSPAIISSPIIVRLTITTIPFASLLFAVMHVFCVFRIVFVVNCSHPLPPSPLLILSFTHTYCV